MALDAATLALVATELKSELEDARIDKIFQPSKEEIVFQMRSRVGTSKLFISAKSGSARVCVTEEQFENPAVPPSFCMLLRKYLNGAKLVDIRCVEGERIVFFDFMATNEIGDRVKLTAAVELMGRYANFVLINEEERIIDVLKRIDAEASSVRQLLPGLTYSLPPKQNKPYFFSLNAEQAVNLILAQEYPLSDAILKAMGGVGPVVCREIAYRAFGAEDIQANFLTEKNKLKLSEVILEVKLQYAEKYIPNMVSDEDGKPVEYSFLPLTQYGGQVNRVEFNSFSGLLDAFYATKDKRERLKQKSRNVLKQVHNLYERALRKQEVRGQEWVESQKDDDAKLYGELLSVNLHNIKKGQTSVIVQNYYNDKNVEIPLDARLSPSANSQKYFKEYRKKQTAKKVLEELLAEGEKEIAYLNTVQYEANEAESEIALNEIRQELKEAGYLKNYKHKDKKQKPTDFLRYISSDGFLILVGRNNTQNEKLTMKTARGKDLWFHIKDAPGSHVVVMSEGKDIPLSTQNEAAMLAVWYSSQKSGTKIEVDYTEVRNIKKPSNPKPGMVIYDNYQTAVITVEETELPKQAD